MNRDLFYEAMEVDFNTANDLIDFFISERVRVSANIQTGHLAVYVDGEIKQVYKDVKLQFLKSVIEQAIDVAIML